MVIINYTEKSRIEILSGYVCNDNVACVSLYFLCKGITTQYDINQHSITKLSKCTHILQTYA